MIARLCLWDTAQSQQQFKYMFFIVALDVVELDIKMKIDTLIDYSYDRTIERLNAIEGASVIDAYRTMLLTKHDSKSFLLAYLHYYTGCFEGILFTRFLEEFNRMPTPSENAFIKETLTSKFEMFKTRVMDAAEKTFNEVEKPDHSN